MPKRSIGSRFLLTLAPAMVVLGALCGAWAAIPDPRKPIDPQGPLARQVGVVVQIDKPTAFGTGMFLPGSGGCLVLTNFHVAFGTSKDRADGAPQLVDQVDSNHWVNFLFDLDATTHRFRQKQRARVIEFGNYEYGTNRGLLEDIAVLQLENCKGQPYDQIEMARPPAGQNLPAGPLMSIGVRLSPDGKFSIVAHYPCGLYPGARIVGTIHTTCMYPDTGMSGSPIFEQGPDQVWRIAAMTSNSMFSMQGDPIGIALYASTLNKFLDPILAARRSLPDQRR